MFKLLSDSFWNESFWFLSRNATWVSIENPPAGIYYPRVRDLSYCLFAAGGFWAIRKLARPVGSWLSSSIGLQEVAKTNPEKVPELDLKFNECFRRVVAYFFLLSYGFYALHDVDYLFNLEKCWVSIPAQHVPHRVANFFLLALGYYVEGIIGLLVNPPSKEHNVFLVHHIITIYLLVFSWSANYVRIGTVVLLVRELMDPLLELSKMMNYTGNTALSATAFFAMAATFFVTRLYVYPFYILHSLFFHAFSMSGLSGVRLVSDAASDGLPTIPLFHSWTVFAALLTAIQLLDVMWAMKIVKVLQQIVNEKHFPYAGEAKADQ